MVYMPYVPMHPAALPAQRITEVVTLEPRPEPEECIVGFGKVPRKYQTKNPPRNPLYLGQMNWSWSPMHSRIDAYYLHRGRHGWVLWVWMPVTSDWYWEWEVAGFMSKAGVSERQAAQYLVMEFWKYEKEWNDLEHFHWINVASYLSVAEMLSISAQVWPEERGVQSRDEDEGGS